MESQTDGGLEETYVRRENKRTTNGVGWRDLSAGGMAAQTFLFWASVWMVIELIAFRISSVSGVCSSPRIVVSLNNEDVLNRGKTNSLQVFFWNSGGMLKFCPIGV